jgi:sortase A
MTLLGSRDGLEPIEPELEISEAEVVSDLAPGSSNGSGRRGIAIALVVLTLVVAVVALFQGPVQDIWYRNRQHHLAADMNTARAGVAPGRAIAVLQIPRLGLNVVVVEGDDAERLRSGPGHRVGTAAPGSMGNSVIAGHSRAWGGPFAALEKVRKGDLIAIQTRAKKTIVYRVMSETRVGGAGARLIPETKDHRLTLVTGRGSSLSDDRFVVTAVSGTPSGAVPKLRPMSVVAPHGSVIFNTTLLLALAAFALALSAALYLRRRSGPLAVGAVVVPFMALGALCLLLDLDLLLPALR